MRQHLHDKEIDFVVRTLLRVLGRMSIDTSGRLRTAVESSVSNVIASGTVTALTNITNWGLLNTTSRTQLDTYIAFQQGYGKNIARV
jgi:hypothetical protein